MDITLLKQVVIEQNTRTIPDDFVPRTIYEAIRPFKLNKEIIIITGIRRCGKSTLLQKIRKEEKENAYYLNFEDDRLINFTVSDFQLLLEVFTELFGPQKTFYFDEIQNIPNWERFIRRLHDDSCKIYITGSNATMLSKELGTKLTGRYIAITMYPYSYYEYVNHEYNELLLHKKAYTTADIAMARRLFNDYYQIGGIPEFVRLKQPDYLHSLYEGVIYRDIVTRYKLPQEKPIKELTFYLSSHIGKETTFSALRKIINISSANTVSDYCNYLENSFLCFLINRYSHSLKQQMHYEKKLYFVDHALAACVGFRTSEDRGRFLENIVFIELKRRNKTIYYHKEKKECNFIIKHKNRIESVIQVCVSLLSQHVKKREYAGLLEAMKIYELKEGLILTEHEEYQEAVVDEETKYVINVMPLWKWLVNV